MITGTRIIKEWTLPVAMAFGTLVYLVFAFVPWLDGCSQFFAPVMEAVLPLFMFLVLFVTFCKVDFHKMRPVWWHLWVSVLNLVIVAMAMAALLSLPLFGTTFPASTKVLLESVLMCIIAPCATAAAVVTQKLGGSLEQTTTFTFISNIITALLVPLCFPLIEKGMEVTFLAAFSKTLCEVASLLVLPMLLAYIVKHFCHRLHRFIIGVRDLSFYLWGCSLTIVTGITVRNIVHAQASLQLLLAIAFLGLAVCVAQFALGRYVGHFSGRAQEAGQALGQKNTALAIWLSTTYLQPLSSVGPGCYILWQNIINSMEIYYKMRDGKAEHEKLEQQ